MALYFIPKYREKFPILTQEDLTSLNDLNDVSEQMQKLSQLLEIPAEEYNERRAACAEFRELLRKYYPDCLLLMFGSSVNGFGVKGCDLDLLFLPFPGYCNLDYVAESEKSEKVPIPEPASILTGEVSRSVLSKFDEFSHLKFIRTILRREKTQVKKVNFIPAKCPTLKVHLNNCKIVCDMSASNRLVVFNSELLQFFEKLDPRIKPLVMTLRFFARSLGLIKRSFFSSYAFTLLIIFFLQNTNPPILPSVQHLTEKSGFSRMTAGWQTAFDTDVQSVPKTKNTETLSELLLDFLEYYWNFNFVEHVVCPYSGKVLLIKDLKNSADERMAGFEVSSLNIQDPFILSRNVCKIEGPKIVFKLALLTAYEMLKNKNEKLKFSMLFDANEFQRVLDFHYNKFMLGRPKVCFINLEYDIVTNLSKVPYIYTENAKSWYEKASTAVFETLQYGLLIECEVTDKISGGNKTMANKNNDIVGNHKTSLNDKSSSIRTTLYDLELIMSIQCVLYCRTWMGRKNVTAITVNEDELEEFPGVVLKAEYNISKELVNKNPLLNSPVPVLCFKCDIYKHSSPQIADIVVMLKPLTLSREFYQVSAFLASFIPKTVKKILTTD